VTEQLSTAAGGIAGPGGENADHPVSPPAALVHAILLSALFLVVYGGTSWITSWRSDVGTWYYAWERWIPFVPLMIVPYMSIDVFFVAAPFVCRSRGELRLLSRRITFAILVAGICFLVYPLQLAVTRPTPTGWLGAIWTWFIGLDRPYNLLPSLHITLRTILADLYSRHTHGLARWVTNAWFSLIGLSTLLTYQHHVVDVIGGFILATFCFYLVGEAPWRLPMERNLRVGSKYAALGLALSLVCAAAWPWSAVLLWPIVAVAIVMLGYFFLGPAVYRKQNGRLPLSAKVVLAPVLLGQYVSWLYYRRQCRAWDEVVPGVWIGRRLSEREAADAVSQGVAAVLDLSVEFSEARPFLAIPYCHVPILDLTAPAEMQLAEAVAFIDKHAAQGVVYVHCKIGYSRSAAAVGAWLLATGRVASVEDAIERLRSSRSAIVIRPEILRVLVQWQRRLS
jgi:membrane-associated phospholipid phosphatase